MPGPFERIGGRQKTHLEKWSERLGLLKYNPNQLLQRTKAIEDVVRENTALLFSSETGFRRNLIEMSDGELLVCISSTMATMENLSVAYTEKIPPQNGDKPIHKRHAVSILMNKNPKYSEHRLTEIEAPGLEAMRGKSLAHPDQIPVETREKMCLLLQDLLHKTQQGIKTLK